MKRLERIIIERDPAGGWCITRQRAENGERLSGAPSLAAAFDFIRALYDEHGEPTLAADEPDLALPEKIDLGPIEINCTATIKDENEGR